MYIAWRSYESTRRSDCEKASTKKNNARGPPPHSFDELRDTPYSETVIKSVVMAMKTYNFKIFIEPDEDFDGNPSGWHVYCLGLKKLGGATWSETRDEALKNINKVVRLVVESTLEHGEPIPEEPADQVEVTVEPRVAVTV
jgi:predicted RNase H-like HicB family nuclease